VSEYKILKQQSIHRQYFMKADVSSKFKHGMEPN